MTIPLGSAQARSLLSLDRGTDLFQGHDTLLAEACLTATSHSPTALGHVPVLCDTSRCSPNSSVLFLQPRKAEGRTGPLSLCNAFHSHLQSHSTSSIYLRLTILPLQRSHLDTSRNAYH